MDHVDRPHTRHPTRHFFVWRVQGRFGGYGYGYGHGGVGVIGIVLIILVVLLVMGRI
jgi:Protein of unknown function (DUF3309)